MGIFVYYCLLQKEADFVMNDSNIFYNYKHACLESTLIRFYVILPNQ